MKSLAIGLFFLSTLSGCASIVSGGPEIVTINSNPSGATMILCNERTGSCLSQGTTPYTATLDRGQGFFKKAKYTITLKKEGYGTVIHSLHADLNGWYFGNIVFGGLIGILIVDPATGAMWDIDNQNIVLDLPTLQSRTDQIPYSHEYMEAHRKEHSQNI